MEELKITKWVLRFEDDGLVGGKLIGILSDGKEVNAGHGFLIPYNIKIDGGKRTMTADLKVEIEGEINFNQIKEYQ